MSSVSKNPGTVSQVTGGKFQSFSNLGNIKNVTEGSYAVTGTIQGKSGSPNRPSTISCTNFGFSLPTGAEVTSVKVTLRHKKSGSCNIPAPTLTLLGVSGLSKKAFAPSASMTNKSYTFKSSKLTRTIVNGSGFGVKVDYPTNSGSGTGTVSVSYVRINVEYKVPSYSLSLKKVSGGFNEEPYIVEATISNKTLTAYNPSLTLSAPVGFSFTGSAGRGVVTRVNSRTLTWDPKLTGKVGSSTVRFSFDTGVTFPSGVDVYTGTFTLVESLNSTTKSHTATISKNVNVEEEPSDGAIVSDENYGISSSEVIYVEQDEPFFILSEFTDEEITQLTSSYYAVIGCMVTPKFADEPESQSDTENMGNNLLVKDTPSSNWDSFNGGIASFNGILDENHHLIPEFKFAIVGDFTFYLEWMESSSSTSKIMSKIFKVRVTPKTLNPPYFSIIEPTTEETDRLGTGHKYIAQADIKENTTETIPLKWGKSYRIGVFNNDIENVEDYTSLTDNQIFENALYWSDTIKTVNEYNSLECEFTYNEDYPIYILITGDYTEATTYNYDMGTITHTEPAIIEKTVYQGRETNGHYPTPINNLLNNEDSAEITLNGYTTSTPVRAYDLPIEDYNDNIAIRGIELQANIESADPQIIQAKLISPTGETGQRSIVLTQEDTTVDSANELVLGGLGDLWGFTPPQLVDLANWEIEISNSNLLSNEDSTLNYHNLQIIFYIETITQQNITVQVEDEDISYYGAFIQDINIPEGLNTDTSYLTIDGTDTNDAYRQNIREKTITLEFSIDSCDLQTSTDMLRQLTKLFVNEKDQYNRPIPNRITFSHYPDDYFEYILQDTLDITTEVTGYNVKAKLVIPAGTSYTREDIVTNTTGYVKGLAAINPIITLQPSDENIEITEAISGQTFNIGYTGSWNDKVVVIDCEDRKVYLKTSEEAEDQTDISKYVDYNADWFRLYGEYEFESTNCTIRTITYNERW